MSQDISEFHVQVPSQLTRAATIEQRGGKPMISISSTAPCLRYSASGGEYFEVLGHGPGDIDDSRMRTGLPVLFNHSTADFLGRATKFHNDGQKLYAGTMDDIIWGETEQAIARKKEIEKGALPGTSVAYEVLEGEQIGKKEGVPIIKFRWRPHEFSFCPTECDVTVGLGRAVSSTSEGYRHVPYTARTDENYPLSPQLTRSMKTAELPELSSRQLEEAAEKIQGHRDAVIAMTSKPHWKRLANEYAEKAVLEGWRCSKYREELNKAIGDYDTAHPQAVRDYEIPDNDGAPHIITSRTRGAGDDFGRLFFQHGRRAIGELKNGGKKTVSFSIPGINSVRAMSTIGDFGNGTTHLGGPHIGEDRASVADLLMQGTSDSPSVIYPRENTFTSAADTVGEAGQKPEQSFDVDAITDNAKKIAVWTTLTTELLEDSPASEAYIQRRLALAAQIKTDDQILFGDGLGNNMRGIFSTAGVQTRAYATSMSLTLRKAATDVEVNTEGFRCSGYIMNPIDWETASVETDLEGHYLAGSIFMRGEAGQVLRTPSIWGLPVVVSKAVPQGKAYAGDWSNAAQFIRRTGLHFELSNQHSDYFTRNLVAMLCELRGLVAVFCPGAFLEITGLPARS